MMMMMIRHHNTVCVVTAQTFKNEHQRHVRDSACLPSVDLTTNASTSVTGQSVVIVVSFLNIMPALMRIARTCRSL